MPTASAVMVFHRLNPFFAEAVGSVLGQTWRDLELVLVDNGCGCGPEVLGEAGRDPRITWVRLPGNAGITGGHNAGIAAAKGEFVMLLDYDDVAMPTRLEKQIAALRADPGLGLVSSCAESIDECGVVIGREFSLLGAEEQYVYTHYTTPVVTPAFSGRREVFAQFPYREAFPYAGDYDFLARAAEKWRMRGLPEVLFRYRHHAQQTTVQRGDSQVLSACLIRLLTARRRAGRPEGLAEAVAELGGWLKEPPGSAEIYERFARWSLREGFGRLAVFHARRAAKQRGGAGAAIRAAGVWLRAVRGAPGDTAMLTKLFLAGPVRAHGLKPA